MKNLRRTFTVLFAAAFSMQVLAQREDKLINQDWSFRFSHQVNASAARRVDLLSEHLPDEYSYGSKPDG